MNLAGDRNRKADAAVLPASRLEMDGRMWSREDISRDGVNQCMTVLAKMLLAFYVVLELFHPVWTCYPWLSRHPPEGGGRPPDNSTAKRTST